MGLPPRIIWVLPAAYVVLLVPLRIGYMVVSPNPDMPGAGPAGVGVAAIVALVALQLLIVLPQVRRPRPGWLLAGQAVLTFGPYAVLGSAWGPIAGMLASAVLLTLAAPLSWLLFALVVLGDTAVVTLAFPETVPPTRIGYVLVDLNVGLSLFALTRLAKLAGRAHNAGEELAALEVARDRLQVARDLRAKLGGTLAAIIAHGRQQPHRPRPAAVGHAGGGLTEIGELARQGLADARTIADAHRTIDLTAEHTSATAVPAAGRPREPTTIAPRLAWWMLLATVAVIYPAFLVNNLTYNRPPTSGSDWAAAMVALPVAVALQLYHGAPRLDGSTPRAWPWTLAAHLLVTFALVGYVGRHAAGPAVLALGAVLVRVRLPWSWVMVTTGMLVLAVPPTTAFPGFSGQFYVGAWALWGALAVYAYCLLPDVTRHLHDARHRLARTAVVRERLRISRDIHDRLGFHLSAINLKADLAARLAGDPAASRTHLHELVQTADEALGEVRAITHAPADLTLHDEAAAARAVLHAAGIDTHLDLPATPLPAGVDTVLATVVREAVTNVIRHAAARTCTITATVDDGVVRLQATNDGATVRAAPAAPRDRVGTGLANLTARCEASGGHLTTHTHGDTFTVRAEIPTDNATPTR